MRAVATPGRWIWGLSGLVTTAALVISGTLLITSAGRPENAQPQSIVTRTVTVPQPVTSLTVQSYGAPVEVTAGPVRHVRITETFMYDSQAGSVSAVPVSAQPAAGGPLSASPAGAQPAAGGPLSASPAGAQPASDGSLSGPPTVEQSVSGGGLSLADPVCETSDCSVSFALTVPSGVTATVTTEGGSVSVSGVAAANLDSGGGDVRAVNIGGPLTVSTDGGPLTLDGLAGALAADTGGGSLSAQGVAAATATVITGGGDAWMVFSAAPHMVLVSTDGGAATLKVPGGPYALNADSGGGEPESLGIATDPFSHSWITVSTGGGPLWVGP